MTGHHSLPMVLLLTLFTSSISGQLIVSIDCGASEITTDLNLIPWIPDDDMIFNGVSRVVQSTNSVSKVMDTMRVFTTRKKNCYSYPVTQGGKLLLRASFNYENYDLLSNPPTFDLHFDGNFWTTVETTSSGTIWYEVIYVAKGDAVSVCVAQTIPGQFPFISALEIRSVDSDVYSEVDENRALFLVSRLSYCASARVRFPKDRYDRIWKPVAAPLSLEKVTNDAIFIDTTAPNNPPTEIFENAITVEGTSSTISLGQIHPSNPPLYINFYFSEVTSLDSTEKRSFRISATTTLGNNPLQLPVLPPYMSVVERYLYDFKVTLTTNISLVPTADSNLPPLINALEMFSISDVLAERTNSNDVKALTLLISTFNVLKGWSGDPCLPASYSWEWITCSSDDTPRVTSLYLDSYGLSGFLPDISAMDALQIIDLHNNSLIGTIPSFLGTMPNLQELNLADNQFSGSIPTSLSNNNNLKLTVTGNPSLCKSGKSCSSSPGTQNSSPGSTTSVGRKKKKSSMLPVILGIVIPLFFLMWVAVGVFIVISRKTKRDNANMPPITPGGVANANRGGGAHENPDMGHRIGENEIMLENVGPSARDTSGQDSNIYGQTGVQNP